ncbi:MAG: insulinase family protein [Candidatus Rokubacteria bacterium]|nr:insulinase family protein [Candidatus Rokubacteria bacterium]
MKAVQLFQMRRQYRNLGRLRDIVNVFLKHGLGQVIEALQLHDVAPIRWWYKPLHARLDRGEIVSPPERLRMAFEELGPTFIKFGQLLSTRTDLLPREYVAALDSLLDQVPPFPGDQVRRIIEHDLKRPLREAVARFDDVPIAAASIAQVHRAMLWTGEEVVFKVRRPGIREMVRNDVAILRRVAQLLDRYAPNVAFVNAVSLVEEFNQAIHEEMDFLREAENIIRIRDNFADSLDLMADFVLRPAFPADQMEKVRGDLIASIQALEDDSYGLTNQEFYRALYSRSPYQRPIIGISESIRTLKREDLAAFHGRTHVASNIIVAVVGDLRRAEAVEAIRAHFGGLPGVTAPALPGVEEVRQPDRRVKLIRKERDQATFNLGMLGASVRDPDYLACQAAVRLLASRFFFQFVYEKGGAYRAWFTMPPRRYASPVAFVTGVQAGIFASTRDEVLADLRAFLSSAIPAEELATAKAGRSRPGT